MTDQHKPDRPDGDGLLPCQYCKKPPGTKVGPPAMARCITYGCEGYTLAALPVEAWNTRAQSRDAAAAAAEGARDVARCLETIESAYDFECSTGSLKNCGEWKYLKRLLSLPVQPGAGEREN